MTNNLKKLVLNWQEYSIPQGTTYTAWENIEISSWVISANNSYIITESDMTKSTTKTYWVAPYNTSYYYTNYTINANSGIKWVEWAWYTFVIDTQTVASAYRNTRVRIWTGDYIPVMSSGWAILWWHSYFTKANSRCYQYSTRYESWWALHLMTDSNTTYSAMSTAEIDAWTGTTARLITPTNLKYAIENLSPSQVDNTAYAASWDWVTGTAPSKNAVYDKINAMDTTISWKQDTLVSGTSIKTINNESLLWSWNITIESWPTYTAWKNVSISSNTINSDSTSILTQSDYDNLPSSKNSDDKTYFICEATLLTYAEIVSMATGEWEPRTNTIAVLNSAPLDYYNMLSSGWNLTSVTLTSPRWSFPTISWISEQMAWVYRYIAYSNWTWVFWEKHKK